jgi:non-homologous end joining protein Ku
LKAIANTTIRFGLIALPSQVCPAVESANDVTFEQAGPNGERLRQVYVDPQGKEVHRGSIQKGVWDGDDFKPVAAEALEAISEATKIPDLSILEVVARDAIPMDRICGKYFVQSAKKGGNLGAFKLFVDALEEEGLAAVTKWTARSRQKLMALVPENGNLVGYALSFADDCRQPDESVEAHKTASYAPAEFTMARQLLAAMKSEGEAVNTEVDEAIALKQDLFEKALSGKPIRVTQPEPAAPVSSLADALGAMLAAQKEEQQLRAARA